MGRYDETDDDRHQGDRSDEFEGATEQPAGAGSGSDPGPYIGDEDDEDDFSTE